MKNLDGIRKFRFGDFFELTRIMGKEWNLGKRQSETRGNVCAWLYAFSIGADANELYTYEKDGRIVGFIGYNAYKTRKKLSQYFYNLLFKIFYFHPFIKYRNRLDEYYENYEYVPEEMKLQGSGGLTILIVEKNFRSQGYGHKLFAFIIDRLEKNGVKRLLIETDESCNVPFYEKNGCYKLKEFCICDEQGGGGKKSLAYLFEKRVSSK